MVDKDKRRVFNYYLYFMAYHVFVLYFFRLFVLSYYFNILALIVVYQINTSLTAIFTQLYSFAAFCHLKISQK